MMTRIAKLGFGLVGLAGLVACNGSMAPEKDDVEVDDTGVVTEVDADGDGFNADEDCDDANADVNPDATEVVGDGIDNNCDGIETDEATQLFYWDAPNTENYGGYAVAICDDGPFVFAGLGDTTLYGFNADTKPSGEGSVVTEEDATSLVEGQDGYFLGLHTDCQQDESGREWLLLGEDYNSENAKNGGMAYLMDASLLAMGGEFNLPGDEETSIYAVTKNAYIGDPNLLWDVNKDGCTDWLGTSTGMGKLWVLEGDCTGGWSGSFEVETQMDLLLEICDESGASGYCGISIAATEDLIAINDPNNGGGKISFFQLPLVTDSVVFASHEFSGTTGNRWGLGASQGYFYLGSQDTSSVHVFDGGTGEELEFIQGPINSGFGQSIASCTDDAAGIEYLVVGAPLLTDKSTVGGFYAFDLTTLGGAPTSYEQAEWFAFGPSGLQHLGYSVDCQMIEYAGNSVVGVAAGAWWPPSSGDSGAAAYILQ